jgi:hypothetical protein
MFLRQRGEIQEKGARILRLKKKKYKTLTKYMLHSCVDRAFYILTYILTKYLPWREIFFFFFASRRVILSNVIHNSARNASLEKM